MSERWDQRIGMSKPHDSRRVEIHRWQVEKKDDQGSGSDVVGLHQHVAALDEGNKSPKVLVAARKGVVGSALNEEGELGATTVKITFSLNLPRIGDMTPAIMR